MTDPDHRGLMTRRRSLAVLGSAGAGLWVAGRGLDSASARTTDGDDYIADAARACTLTAEQEEGPFYVALDQLRENIVGGQPGLSLALEITVMNSRTCKPLRGAAVDIWHCNASGVYSDISSEQTVGDTWLRGVQITDRHGQATFTTVFPGHYAGRTTHIHVRVHVSAHETSATISGGHICHTGQLFPSQTVYRQVYALAPYREESAAIVTHAEDRVWTQQHGVEQQLSIRRIAHRLGKGLTASVTMAVDPSATPALIGAASTGSPPGLESG
jgi:protocatechuate 3,4-dioxygenase beta subunit